MGLLKNADELDVDVNDDRVPDEGRDKPERIMVPPEPREEQQPSGDPIPIEQEKPLSRRERTRREVEETIARANREAEERFTRMRDEDNRRWEQRLFEMEQRQRQVAQQAAPAPQQQATGPDPDELLRQARKAVDAKDFDEYERLTQEATLIKAERRMEAKLKAIQPAQQQPQTPMWFHGLVAQYPRVASDKGQALLHAKAQELNILTGKQGEELFADAFKQADAILGGQASVAAAGRATFDRSSAAVLSGVPAKGAPSTNPSGEKVAGVRLTDYERYVAKKLKVPEDEYAKNLAQVNPRRIEK